MTSKKKENIDYSVNFRAYEHKKNAKVDLNVQKSTNKALIP